MTDPITDMLNRIRNGLAAKKEQVVVPYSDLKNEVAQMLEKGGFIGKIEKKGRKAKKVIEIALKYNEGEPAILGMKKVSKPGQRIYVSSQKIRPVRGGYGISIISTSQGLMTDKDAKRKKIGGEILCEIW